MSNIDKRIVEMEFENKGFEKGIKESSTSLKDFNNALEETAGGGSKVSGLGGIAQGIAGKFGVLGTVATGALLRIGSMAVDTGLKLVKALSLQQVMDGFTEYELKMNAIKVMLASGKMPDGTDVDLDYVNKKLQELNLYADRTVYSFKDMTQTIGKFTNAGVNIDLAVDSIMGISNQAALAGASTEQAGSAMNSFARSLAQGFMSLRQWRSIEVANMGTVEFKNQLLEAGVAAGTLEKRADGMYNVITEGASKSKMGNVISATKEFQYSLHNQWLTTDVLTSTLEQYSDVTTEIGKKANEAATKVRTWTQLKDTVLEALGSGWGVTFERILGDFEQATDLWTGISQKAEKIIHKNSEERNAMIADFMKINREPIIDSFYTAWDSLAKILGVVKEAFRDVFPKKTTLDFIQISKKIRQFTRNITVSRETLQKLKSIFTGIFSALSLGWKGVSAVFKGISDGVKGIIDSFPKGDGGGVLDFFAKIFSFFTNLNEAAKEGEFFVRVSEGIANGIGWIATKIGELVTAFKDGTVLDSIVQFFRDINIDIPDIKLPDFKGFGKIGEFLVKIGQGIGAVFTGIKDGAKNLSLFGKIKKALGDFVLFIKDKFGPQIDRLKAIGKKIKEFFGDNFNFEGMVDAFTKLGGLFIAGGLASKIGDFISSFAGVGKESSGFIKGLKKDITSLGGVKGILGEFQGILKAYQSNLNSKKLLTIASAIALLVASLVVITLIDQTKLAAGVAVITALFINLSAGLVALSKAGNPSKMAASMVLMAGAVLILSLSLAMLKNVDPEAIYALSIIVAELVAANILMSKLGDNKKGTVGLLGMAAAIQMLAGAIFIFSKMDPEGIKQGLEAVSILMAELLVFSLILGNFGGSGASLLAAGVAMGIMAIALLELVGVVAILAQFNPEKLGTGLLGLAGIMAIVAAGMLALANPQVLVGAAAMLAMAVAIGLFVPSIAALGSLPIEQIGIALLAIVGLFTVLGLAAVILTPVIPVIFALAASIALLGIAVLAAGAGMALFGAGLALVAASGAAAVSVLILAVTSLATLLPFVMTQIGKGIIALAEVIIEGAPVVAEAVVAIIEAIVSLLTEQVPVILGLVLKLIGDLLALLVEKVPEFVDAGMKIILGFLQGIADNLPEIIATILQLLIDILDVIAEKLPDLIESGVNIVTAFLEGIGKEVPKVVDAAFQMIIDFINGLADSIETNTPLILDAVANLATAFIDGVKDYLNIEEGKSIAGSIISGLVSGANAGVNLVVSAVEGLGKAVIAGVKAILGIHSPSSEFEDIGEDSDLGFVNGIKRFAGKVTDAATGVGEQALDALRRTMSGLSDVINADINDSPIITPVLDLNQVQSGANALNSLLATGHTYGLAASQIEADRIVTEESQNGSPTLTDGQGQSITNEFNLNGITIRTEADIEKLAEKLYRKQESAMRSRGMKPSYT